MRAILIALCGLALAGCATDYSYMPEVNATAQVGGQAAADYPIPPEAPEGDVRVASFGITRLQVNSSEHVRALHLRLVITNRGQTPWTLDTRSQLLQIAYEGESRPIFASADSGQLPEVSIAPGAQRAVDLFYPLPADLQHASRLPAFDLVWRVDTGGGRTVAIRTPFARVTSQPDYAYGYTGYYEPAYWEPIWWYDPGYFQYTFVRPVVIRHHPVIVGRRAFVRHHATVPGHPPVIVAHPPVQGRAPVRTIHRPPMHAVPPPSPIMRTPAPMVRPPPMAHPAPPISRPAPPPMTRPALPPLTRPIAPPMAHPAPPPMAHPAPPPMARPAPAPMMHPAPPPMMHSAPPPHR